MSSLSTLRVVAVLTATILPAATFAQTAPSTTSPAQTASADTAPVLPTAVSAKVEEHIKNLHDQLKITPAQDPQWEQFAQIMRENAARMTEAFKDRGANVGAMNAADNMQSYAQLAQVHAANMEKLASAFRSLYNIFPDHQKHIADGVFKISKGKPPTLKR